MLKKVVISVCLLGSLVACYVHVNAGGSFGLEWLGSAEAVSKRTRNLKK